MSISKDIDFVEKCRDLLRTIVLRKRDLCSLSASRDEVWFHDEGGEERLVEAETEIEGLLQEADEMFDFSGGPSTF